MSGILKRRVGDRGIDTKLECVKKKGKMAAS